uniref:Uncharacterized protein LOC111120102 n=1 Tax=Crassostrea virginica TaxID=6565 RepID=A0A8B8CPZ5_CRAVI|nr:uncharacterized protein LOC111120102 [Crassostrea virginica]
MSVRIGIMAPVLASPRLRGRRWRRTTRIMCVLLVKKRKPLGKTNLCMYKMPTALCPAIKRKQAKKGGERPGSGGKRKEVEKHEEKAKRKGEPHTEVTPKKMKEDKSEGGEMRKEAFPGFEVLGVRLSLLQVQA